MLPPYDSDRGDENTDAAPAPDLNATDYRANPSAGMQENLSGTAVPPMPDRSIQSYDLPGQLAQYDRMGRDGK